MYVCLTDLITHDNFFGNRLRGFESVRGRFLPFSYLQAVAVNTVLAYRDKAVDCTAHRAACDSSIVVEMSII